MQTGKTLLMAPATLAAPEGLSLSSLMTAHIGSRLVQSAAVEATHEHCRALLAKGAMDDVVALSALEAHFASMVPASKDRLKTLVDTYTISAAMRVAGR